MLRLSAPDAFISHRLVGGFESCLQLPSTVAFSDVSALFISRHFSSLSVITSSGFDSHAAVTDGHYHSFTMVCRFFTPSVRSPYDSFTFRLIVISRRIRHHALRLCSFFILIMSFMPSLLVIGQYYGDN